MKEYRADIDGLRAIAVIPVVLFHAGYSFFSGGYVGVDVFFVISGYLITSIILAEIEQGKFTLVSFYERRARRLLPALYLVALTCVPFSLVLMPPAQYYEFSKSLVSVSLFVSNILFWSESGYFAAVASEKPLLHTWSLAVEEQFYIAFPLAMLAIWRFCRPRLLLIAALTAIASFALCVWAAYEKPTANFYLFPTRAWELCLGVIAALLLPKRASKRRGFLADLGLGMILASIVMFNEETPFPSIYALLPTVGTFFVIMFADEGAFSARLLRLRPLVGVGLISYSTYLWHQPLLAFTSFYFIEGPSGAVTAIAVICAFALAFPTWRFVERPFRQKNSILKSRSMVFSLSACGALVLICLGLAGVLTKGFEDRFSTVLQGDVNHDEFIEYLDVNFVDCEPKVVFDQSRVINGTVLCKQSTPGLPDWILLGDSHAEHLFPGLAEANPDVNVAFYSRGHEPFLQKPNFQIIFDSLLTSEKKFKIFFSMYYYGYDYGNSPLSANVTDVVKSLRNAGHEVVLLGDVPKFEIHPQKCLIAKDILSAKGYCSIPKEKIDKQLEIYEIEMINVSRQLEVPFVALTSTLCTESICSMVRDDTIFYRDNHHLNLPGSRYVGAYISEQVELLSAKTESTK